MLWMIYFPLGPVDTFLFLMPIGLKVKKKKKNSRLLVGVDGSRANVLQPHESSLLAISPIYELWKPNPKAKKIKKSKSILV